MNTQSVKTIYFSPTQTTKKIVEAICQGTQFIPITDIDLTLARVPDEMLEVKQNQLAIIGSPVYAGRVPLPVLSKLQVLKGNGGPAIIVVVYGNRAYEDALIELREMVKAAGFNVIAAAAFIGEHSYSTGATPVGAGRPDPEDITKAAAFGKSVLDKITTLSSFKELAVLAIPGNHPYKERSPLSNISSDTIEANCIKCNQCVSVCPMGVIKVGATVVTDKGGCIRCCACVRICPTNARVMREPRIQQLAEQLSMKCSLRKEPEMFMGEEK